MIVTCASCSVEYDDVHRLTFCPHAPFAMRTVAHAPGKPSQVCTSLEELGQYFGWDLAYGPDRTVKLQRLPDGALVELP